MSEQEQVPEQPAVDKGSVKKGVLVGLGLNAALIAVSLLFFGSSGFGVTAIFISITQAVVILPAYLGFRSSGQTESAKGVLIAAGITFLLNATCFGVVLVGFNGPMH